MGEGKAQRRRPEAIAGAFLLQKELDLHHLHTAVNGSKELRYYTARCAATPMGPGTSSYQNQHRWQTYCW